MPLPGLAADENCDRNPELPLEPDFKPDPDFVPEPAFEPVAGPAVDPDACLPAELPAAPTPEPRPAIPTTPLPAPPPLHFPLLPLHFPPSINDPHDEQIADAPFGLSGSPTNDGGFAFSSVSKIDGTGEVDKSFFGRKLAFFFKGVSVIERKNRLNRTECFWSSSSGLSGSPEKTSVGDSTIKTKVISRIKETFIDFLTSRFWSLLNTRLPSSNIHLKYFASRLRPQLI